jgi:hypothetical protein
LSISKKAWKIGCESAISIEANRGQHALHVRLERIPAAAVEAAPAEHFEVVDDDEAALLDVRAQRLRLAIRERPPADLDDVGDRILEQIRIVQRQRIRVVGVRREVADVVHDLHQVLFGDRVAVDPRRPAAGPVAAGRRFVLDADEREAAVVGDVVNRRHARVLAEVVEAALRHRRGGGGAQDERG